MYKQIIIARKDLGMSPGKLHQMDADILDNIGKKFGLYKLLFKE